ncbi:MAG TPA: phosphoglycolate phosphatase [Marinobacter sp.]|nr:phosphoglycolate phosphatase [Marinobacter sp.]
MSLKGLFNTRWPGVALFDLDGTLVDSVPDLAAAVDQMLEHLGRKPAGQDKVRTWVGNGAGILVRRALADKTDWEPAALKDELLYKDALAIFYHAYGQLNGKHTQVFDGVFDCLNHLAGLRCKMGVVTNKPDRFVSPLLRQTGLDRYFRLWVGGDTLGVKKPDPAPLVYAMEQLGGTRGTTVMVGDSAADVGAAQAAGVPCVAVRYGYNFGGSVNSLGADAVVDSLAELL